MLQTNILNPRETRSSGKCCGSRTRLAVYLALLHHLPPVARNPVKEPTHDRELAPRDAAESEHERTANIGMEPKKLGTEAVRVASAPWSLNTVKMLFNDRKTQVSSRSNHRCNGVWQLLQDDVDE